MQTIFLKILQNAVSFALTVRVDIPLRNHHGYHQISIGQRSEKIADEERDSRELQGLEKTQFTLEFFWD